MSKRLLITHNDLDGVACAVLANIAFDGDVETVIVKNPMDATATLKKLAATAGWKKYSQIFLTDISFFPDQLAGLTKRDAIFAVIKVLDHHATAIEPLEGFPRAVVAMEKDGRKTCGTELFADYLAHKGLLVPRPFFVETVRLYDTWDWAATGNKTPYYLSQLAFALGFTKFIETYADRMARHDVDEFSIFNERERIILEFKKHESDTEINGYLENIRTVKAGGLTFGFVFITGGDQSTLGNRICTEKGVDVAMMVNPNSGKMSVRTTRTDLDLGAIMREHYGNGAGGHAMTAGGVLTADILDKAICSIFSAAFGNVEVDPK